MTYRFIAPRVQCEVFRELENRHRIPTTITEIAVRYGVSRQTLHRWLREMKEDVDSEKRGDPSMLVRVKE